MTSASVTIARNNDAASSKNAMATSTVEAARRRKTYTFEGRSSMDHSRGAPISLTRWPSLMPTFAAMGVPESPAVTTLSVTTDSRLADAVIVENIVHFFTLASR